jgi:rRNA maturation endonuclease Nob1
MMKIDAWFCIDCKAVVELNRHGYCSVCGSDSVDIPWRTSYNKEVSVRTPTAEELEKMYARKP